MSALLGQVAVVTGASRGIGAASAAALTALGATVIRLARTMRATSRPDGLDLPCDVTDEADVAHAADRILREFGAPHLVVNNAGTFALAALAATTRATWDQQIAVNLTGPFLVARAFLPAMRREGRGLHVLLGSIADHHAFPENAAYAASKFGARGLHEVLRAEYAGSGVRCTLLSPGPTDTAVWDPIDPDHREGFLPRARMLQPSDIAEAVAFLATRPPRVHVDWLRLGPA